MFVKLLTFVTDFDISGAFHRNCNPGIYIFGLSILYGYCVISLNEHARLRFLLCKPILIYI